MPGPGTPPVCRVDVGRDLAVAGRFGRMSLPTVLASGDGREVERPDGLMRGADLTAAFDRATGT